MSDRDSRMARASSALTASTAVKPASSTMSTARRRNTISSSTTRTCVEDVGGAEEFGVDMGLRAFVVVARSYLLSDFGLRQLSIHQACMRFLVAQLQLAGDTNQLFHAHNTDDADIVD